MRIKNYGDYYENHDAAQTSVQTCAGDSPEPYRGKILR